MGATIYKTGVNHFSHKMFYDLLRILFVEGHALAHFNQYPILGPVHFEIRSPHIGN